jgi:hypothetical protein
VLHLGLFAIVSDLPSPAGHRSKECCNSLVGINTQTQEQVAYRIVDAFAGVDADPEKTRDRGVFATRGMLIVGEQRAVDECSKFAHRGLKRCRVTSASSRGCWKEACLLTWSEPQAGPCALRPYRN